MTDEQIKALATKRATKAAIKRHGKNALDTESGLECYRKFYLYYLWVEGLEPY